MEPIHQALIWFVPGLIVLICASILIFDEDNKVNIDSFKRSLWRSRGPLSLIFVIGLALQVENLLQDLFEPGFRVSDAVYRFEGVSHIVWMQETLDNQILVHASSIFYVLGFSFFVAMIPIFFMLREEIELVDEFAKALTVNYIFLIAGYLSLHLVVTSHQSGAVDALMYEHEQYYALIQLVNRPVNCWPSGHTSIPFTITLISVYSTKLKRLSRFSMVFTAITIIIILYLGVHWVIDIPGGIMVGIIAYWVASKGKLDSVFEKITDPVEKYTSILAERLKDRKRN